MVIIMLEMLSIKELTKGFDILNMSNKMVQLTYQMSQNICCSNAHEEWFEVLRMYQV